MPLPVVSQEQDFGRRVVTTPALVSSRNWGSGDVWLDGKLAVHYNDGLRDVGAGVQVNVTYLGAFRFACGSAVTAPKNADAFYDTVNRTIVVAPGAGIIYVGKFVNAKTNGQTSALVELNAISAVQDAQTFSLRSRLTIAQINAGATLLPAVAGYRYRVQNARMISVGGAAAAATTVDILGTQAASSVKLMAAAVAGLTQSAVLAAGAANGAVLADGASFAPCDVNTAITANKTGSNVTTAINIDFLIDYVLEAA
jgi:hypothetical protein